MVTEVCPERTSAALGKPDKRGVQRAFGAASARYDGLAALQRCVADRLVSITSSSNLDCRAWLDVGAGTGYGSSRLRQLFPASQAFALDLAEGMLRQLRRSAGQSPRMGLVVGDAEALPIACCSVDLIFSSLALQWCPEPRRAFVEFARVLKPGGHLFFSSFGPATLVELRDAWARVDGYSHVNTFSALHQLKTHLLACGFEMLTIEPEVRVVRYADVLALMRELKGLGAHNVTEDRPRGLVGKGVLAGMIQAYRESHPVSGGGIAATFEVIYGVLKRPDR